MRGRAVAQSLSLLVAFVVLVALVTGCGGDKADARSATTHAPVEGDSLAIARLLDDWHEAAARADEEKYFGYFDRDAIFLGTDRTERWSVSAFRAYAHPHFQKGKAWSFKSITRQIYVSDRGDTAWFDEELDTPNLGVARGSGVLVRRGAGWKIAQYNLTVPIPNERFPEVKRIIEGPSPAPRP